MGRLGVGWGIGVLGLTLSPTSWAQPLDRLDVPLAMRSCLACHRPAVSEFLKHGMSQSLGRVGNVTPGSVKNPVSGNLYEIDASNGQARLRTRLPNGGVLIQPIVGRIGAGRFDTSWVTAEIDPVSFAPNGRLFFAPVETVSDLGLALSPFEMHSSSPGAAFALTAACLECHTDSRLEALSAAGANGERSHVYPSNSLGANAFEELSPLGCEACHGDTREHLQIMTGQRKPVEGVIGIRRLSQLPAWQQRDVCGRCHLQGDVRLTLSESLDTGVALPGRIPVLVAAREVEDHRFVGQLERLALSACFRRSPEMTCNTCHLPHSGALEQGTPRFDAACRSCHPTLSGSDNRGPMEHGRDGKIATGCVNCHLRRSQPFDLPHVQTVDHFIRRRVPAPALDLAHRSYADPEGPLKLFDDGRAWTGQEGVAFEKLVQTPPGRKWKDGVLAMGYVATGRPRDAASGFSQFAAAGTPDARRPSAPPGLIPLEMSPLFHHLRGEFLERSGRPQEAIEAYTDSLGLEPKRAGVRMARARLRFLSGDLLGALEDTQVLITAHPQAEQPWDLRASIALQRERLDLAATALAKSTQLAPSNASAWHLLGKLRLQLGQVESARQALQRAYVLDPKREGLEADLASTSRRAQ